MDFSPTIKLNGETYRELVRVGHETFLVVVGVALHSFLWHYRMGADLGVESADDPDPSHKRDPRYWLCHLLCLIVFISLALRFLVGSRAHSTSTHVESITVDSRWFSFFVWNFVVLIAFGVVLVRAALSQSHYSFLKWLLSFSAIAVVWSLIDSCANKSAWGKWWLTPNLFQGLVTFGLLFFLGKNPGPPHEEAYRQKLVIVLVVLAVCYLLIFPWDLWHIITLSSSSEALAKF